jgi:hypothetical protein
MKLIKLVLLPFVCCAGMIPIYASQHHPTEILRNISSEDRETLTKLFRSLLFDDQFSYTLFGSKPITHKGVFFDTDTAKFIKNWQIWKKYKHFFDTNNSNYVFLEKTYPELFEIHFINKKLVLSTIEKHSSTFSRILGQLTPHEILERMLKSDVLFAALGNSQILYGILLGFGEENAKGFDLDLPDPKPFNKESPKPNHLSLPYFQTYSASQETSFLRKQYKQDREKILSIYSKGDLLEITLTKLFSND